MYQRPQLSLLTSRLQQPRHFLQVLAGPRQVGKTTLARQAMTAFAGKTHYASADLPAAPDALWIVAAMAVGKDYGYPTTHPVSVGRGAKNPALVRNRQNALG